MMATLNLPRFIIGIPVWLFSTLVVINAHDASQVRNLCHEHQIKVEPLLSSTRKPSPPPFSSSTISVHTSTQDSKKKKRNNRKKKKQGEGGTQSTDSSHVRGKKLASLSHVRGIS